MSEFEFYESANREIEAGEDNFSCKAFADFLMIHAARQHRIAVEEARVRPIQREAAREYRSLRRSKRLDAALLAASMVGVAVATWFLTSLAVL
jgi:hypothetical protein